MTKKHNLDSMFNPSSIAVVGVSTNPQGWGTTGFARQLLEIGFPGKIYPINPKANEILGLKVYPNVSAIPDRVDYVIIGIPAPGVPDVLKDCVTAGVKHVHIFSSGFGETGEEEGKALEQRITQIIGESHLNVVGPNCMGLWVPASKLAPWGPKPTGTGSVAFLSQSGGHGELFISFAQGLGINLSKVISFGNARGLQAIDFLEYLAIDPNTEIITIYLEGIKEGTRVTQLIKQINRTKPVIVWKAGLTDSGSRAVASHTGSMAGERKIWDAFFAQTGAVRANSLEEIIDVVLAFQHLSRPQGRRTLLLGGGGGNSVAFADVCSRHGLNVPPLSEKIRSELNTYIRLAGNSTRNPLDVWEVQSNPKLFNRSMTLALSDPAIDLAIIDRHVGDIDEDDPNDPFHQERKKQQLEVNDFIMNFAKKTPGNKPLVVAMNLFGNDPASVASAAQLRRTFNIAGVPAYASPDKAALALSRFIQYHEFQKTAFNS